MENELIQIPDLQSLDKALRKLGLEAIEGQENGIPVLTVTVQRTLFMAMVHNQCLKLVYRLREDNFPGDVAFANHWNMTNFVGTSIPMTDGFVMKHESLGCHGIVAGNLRDTLTLFAESVDKFQDEWVYSYVVKGGSCFGLPPLLRSAFEDKMSPQCSSGSD